MRSGLYAHKKIYNCRFSTSNITENTPPNIITTDLLIHFEANDPNSYNGSGNTWVNIGTGGSTYNAELLGEPAPLFSDGEIKSFQFEQNLLNEGSSYLYYNYMQFLRPDEISDDFTYCAWFNTTNVGYGSEHYQLMYCSNCVSCENKNIVFRTRDKNSAINILNLTECWIHNQTRPVEFQFQASSFTCGNKKTGLSKTIGVKKQQTKHAC